MHLDDFSLSFNENQIILNKGVIIVLRLGSFCTFLNIQMRPFLKIGYYMTKISLQQDLYGTIMRPLQEYSSV